MSAQPLERYNGISGPNSFKEKEQHPDHKGRIKIKGLWFWMSGWNRTGADGRPFISWSLEEMNAEQAGKYEAKEAARTAPQQGEQFQQSAPAQQSAPQQQPQPSAAPTGQEPPMDFDDDIPF